MIVQVLSSGMASATDVNPEWYLIGLLVTGMTTLWIALVKMNKENHKMQLMYLDEFKQLNHSNVTAMKEMTRSHDELRASTQNLTSSVNVMNATIQNVQQLLNMELTRK